MGSYGADAGEQITDGYFRLIFNHGGLTSADPEKGTMTERIRYDASELRNADIIERLKNVQRLKESSDTDRISKVDIPGK